MTSLNYPGNELELFKSATNWKNYFSALIIPFIKGDVLEVGAGNGSTAELFMEEKHTTWTCLEPDPELSNLLSYRSKNEVKFKTCEVIPGTIQDINSNNKYDVIMYIDVLEHIENDIEEINNVTKFLKSGGKLVILAPAYQWLFSDFDKSIGHYRRYTSTTLDVLMPDDFSRTFVKYLDSVGVAASFINRLFLHQALPSNAQIKFWDKVIVKLSEIIDRLIFYKFGKSVLAIYQKH